MILRNLFLCTKHQDDWRGMEDTPSYRFFEGVKYYEDDQLFEKLKLCHSGNIIATVGEIGDLEFLDQTDIALLDISNISDYSVVNFRTKSNPKVMSTREIVLLISLLINLRCITTLHQNDLQNCVIC